MNFIGKHGIDGVEHSFGRAEGNGERHFLKLGAGRCDARREIITHGAEEFGIGALKTEDRLFLVADCENGAHGLAAGTAACKKIFRQAFDDPPLLGTRVLSLVDENVIDGAIETLPAALVTRLADGGRLVTGLIERGVTRLATGRKAAGEVALLPLAEIGIPVLPEFAAPKRWSF